MISKQQYERILEELEKFNNPDIRKEQYYTEPSIAGKLIHIAYNDIKDKVVLDLGCGTGFLGIGALLNDAKKVVFVDIDKNALKLLKKNLKYIKENYDIELPTYRIIHSNVNDLSIKEKVDIIIMNPPFGTRNKDIDMDFVKKAFEISNIIYLIHKTSRQRKIQRIAKLFEYKVEITKLDYRMKKQYEIHKKKFKNINLSLYKLIKNGCSKTKFLASLKTI